MIDKLREVIDGRPVAIMMPGPSINTLENRMGEIADLDICWCCFNDFWIMEDRILKPHGKQLEIVMASAKECGVPNEKHDEFLNRNNVIFITEEVSFHHSLEDYKKSYEEKLFFFEAARGDFALYTPNRESPLQFFATASFVILTQILAIGKPEMIIYFGCDGEYYYYGGWTESERWRLEYDQQIINAYFPILIGNTMEAHGLEEVKIINCTPRSNFTVFGRQGYDEIFKLLRGLVK